MKQRTIQVIGATTVSELAQKTESALMEMDSLRKRPTFLGSFPDDPEPREMVYIEEADATYIWNSYFSEWREV